MTDPPTRKAPGAGELTGRKLIVLAQYHALVFFAKVFGQPFWFFEQKRTRILDWIDNERS